MMANEIRSSSAGQALEDAMAANDISGRVSGPKGSISPQCAHARVEYLLERRVGCTESSPRMRSDLSMCGVDEGG